MELEDSNSCKIFVGNVPFQCTKDEFIECFNIYTGFIDGDIINRINSTNSRGFGFITFNSSENADNFLNLKQQIPLKGRNLRFTKYMPYNKKIINDNHNDKNYIFIKNVPKNYKPDDIKNIFEKYNIGSYFINSDIITGESKGTAVVEILDKTNYYDLLNKKEFKIENINEQLPENKNTTLYMSKWKQKIKIKKQNNIDIKEIYRFAYNAGRNSVLMDSVNITIDSEQF